MTLVIICGLTSDDIWVGRGRSASDYLKKAIGEICLRHWNLAVPPGLLMCLMKQD